MAKKVTNSTQEKGAKDAFAKFFEDPSRESFRELLTDNLGEGRIVDFKQEWLPENQLAKKILGFANTGFGCLIFGVAELEGGGLTPIGLNEFLDKADVENKLRKYLPQTLMEQITTWDFFYDTAEYEKIQGMKFQVIIVDYKPKYVPYLPIKNTTDLDDTAIYCRRDGLTVEASYNELQKIINDRLETGHSTKDEMHLKKHLEQLKELYDELPRKSLLVSHSLARLFLDSEDRQGESYQSFVLEMISEKKRIINSIILAK